jgi:hypothetical protein
MRSDGLELRRSCTPRGLRKGLPPLLQTDCPKKRGKEPVLRLNRQARLLDACAALGSGSHTDVVRGDG